MTLASKGIPIQQTCMMQCFILQRFKPLPSIGSRDDVVETDSAVDLRSPTHLSSSHMTINKTASHDHTPSTHCEKEEQLSARALPAEPPPNTPCCVTLCVRLPDGARVKRRFNHSTHTIHTLLLFAVLSLPREVGVASLSGVELASCTVPKVVYSDHSKTLAQAGLTQNTLLCLSIL